MVWGYDESDMRADVWKLYEVGVRSSAGKVIGEEVHITVKGIANFLHGGDGVDECSSDYSIF